MKTNTTVIKNRKDTATLGEDFTVEIQGGPWTHKAGLRTLAKNVMGNGLYIVEGHGTGHVIPRKLFTKFNSYFPGDDIKPTRREWYDHPNWATWPFFRRSFCRLSANGY